MSKSWQLQDAKSRFSELVNKAVHDGPQIVTRRGVDAVVVIAFDEYRRLQGPTEDLVAFFRRAPRAELPLMRSADTGRKTLL